MDDNNDATATEDEEEEDESRLFNELLLLGMLERRLLFGFTFTLRPISFWLALISRVLHTQERKQKDKYCVNTFFFFL